MHSIILPCYNASSYIGECIESVLSQISSLDELIVIDDGSTDHSRLVIQSYADARVRVVLREVNGGSIGEARNEGLKIARGRYIHFLDADDLWPEGRHEIIKALVNQSPHPDVISGRVEHFYSPEIEPSKLLRYSLPPTQHAALPGSTIISSGLMRKIGPFDPELKGAEFVDFMAKVLRCEPHWIRSEKTLLLRRIHLANFTHNKKRMDGAYLKVIKDHLGRQKEGLA